MIDRVYIEEEMDFSFPKERFPKATFIPIQKYTEVFNRKGQNFRLQKINPALIVAKKKGTLLHKTPPLFGIGRENNYYFSHLLNCPFDCRYCFLQGMYASANYVLFANYEDFQREIQTVANSLLPNTMTIFTGYDGDSLALNGVTKFFESFYPFFTKLPTVDFELRTKSLLISPLLARDAIPNVIVAYTLNPSIVCEKIERGAPPLYKRIEAIEKLQTKGWKIGLRFDPVIDFENGEEHYKEFFEELFTKINFSLLHSVTLGPFRLPKGMQKKMEKLAPTDPLFAAPQSMSFLHSIEELLYTFIPKNKVFLCYEQSSSQDPLPVLA